jgi:hypothetical protein
MEKHMDNQLMEKYKYFPLFSGLQMHANIVKPQKRGFIGPSIFPLCIQSKETMEHMLNQCNFSFAYVGSGISSDVHNGPS